MSKIIDLNVNYSSNGGAHSASVLTVEGDIVSSSGASENVVAGVAAIGNSFSTSDLAMNKILEGFVVEEITKTVDSRKTLREFSLVDKHSYILDGYSVLVRGESASPFENYAEYEGRVYDGSELPVFTNGENLDSNAGNIKRGASGVHIDDDHKLVILGSTRSVFTPSNTFVGDGTTFNPKNGKISAVYTGGEIQLGSFPSLLAARSSVSEDMIKNQIDSTSLQYGYTVQEFSSALSSLGFNISSTNGLPVNSSAVINFSGSLRSCISAIASLFGLYWNITKDGEISFFTASQIKQKNNGLSVGTGSNVIKTVESDKGMSPSITIALKGSTQPTKPSQTTFTTSVGNTAIITEKLFRVKIEEIIDSTSKIDLEQIQKLFVLFAGINNHSEDAFDAYFAALKYVDSSFNVGEIYDDDKFDDNVSPVSFSSINKFLNDSVNLENKNTADFYPMQRDSSANRNLSPPRASETNLISFCQEYFKLNGSLYISQPHSKSVAENRTISADGVSMSGPIRGGTRLSDAAQQAPILSSLLKILEFAGLSSRNATVNSLYTSFSNGTSNLAGSDAYYFIGSRDMHISSLNEAQNQNLDSFFTDRVQFINTPHAANKMHLGLSNSPEVIQKAIASLRMFQSHAALVNELDSVKAYLEPIQAEDDNNNNQQTNPEESNPEMGFNHTFFRVKSSTGSKTKSELRQYSGTVNDMKFLSNNFGGEDNLDLLGGVYQVKSVSTSYHSLPDLDIINALDDILTDSISVSLGSDGYQTTIAQSTKKLIATEQSVIIGDGLQSSISNDYKRLFSAGRKNALNI